jgi:hypothetical protein
MRSQSGLKFGIINIIGNFDTVFVDQAYWQSAIAAKPAATFRGCAAPPARRCSQPRCLNRSLHAAFRRRCELHVAKPAASVRGRKL